MLAVRFHARTLVFLSSAVSIPMGRSQSRLSLNNTVLVFDISNHRRCPDG
jgi:hypothetical protein